MSGTDIHKTAAGLRANASFGAKIRVLGHSHGRCEVCGGRFKYYRGHQHFCSSRCRLLRWAARIIVTEYLEGRLPGLKAEIARLRQAARSSQRKGYSARLSGF